MVAGSNPARGAIYIPSTYPKQITQWLKRSRAAPELRRIDTLAGVRRRPTSLWQTIKNAFIPWNLLRSDKTKHEGVRTADYGGLLIDGASGDISGMARVIERDRTASTGPAWRLAGL
ncbi:MAG: hypothetical protein EWM45_06590 [Rhodopseudomonas palustris]|nr:MAG: hypothetical protein EWM45_06590 [Rhodopseudomonas palustris]